MMTDDIPDYDLIKRWMTHGAPAEHLLGEWTHVHWGDDGKKGLAHFIGSRTLIGCTQPDGSRMALSAENYRKHDHTPGYAAIIKRFDELVTEHCPERRVKQIKTPFTRRKGDAAAPVQAEEPAPKAKPLTLLDDPHAVRLVPHAETAAAKVDAAPTSGRKRLLPPDKRG